jgi:uncharacterized protein (TIGR02231 family)
MGVESRITAVTVFNDRAEITRTASVTLEKGEQSLLFDSLPESIDERSVQVKGSGDLLLKDVRLRPVFFDEHPDADIRALKEEEQALLDRLGEMDDRISLAGKERVFIENIAGRLTAVTESSEPVEPDPEKWTRMVEFYRTRIGTLDAEVRGVQAEKRPVQQKLERIRREIEAAGTQRRREKRQLEVALLAESPGVTELQLIYMVLGPAWEPLYDLRVSTDGGTMSLAYHALIRQNTGEDWDGVETRLSTARPGIHGQQPELGPWFLDFFTPRPAPAPMLRAAAGSAQPDRSMKQMFEPQMEKEEDGLMESAPLLGAPGSTVQTGATSVVFSVSGKNSVKSDNNQYRVTVLLRDFPARFRYSAVPKLAPFAYLKAKVVNDTEYPFLPGATNVFLDGNFVARSSMELVAPSEEFWTSLGVDEGMKIEHRLLRRFEMQEGVFGKTVKLVYEYRITATNRKRAQVELVLWDQLPVSGNENIRVTLLEPDYKKDSEALKIDEHSYIEWFFRPKPGEEIKVPFRYSVEYPRNSTVRGLA